MTAIRFKKFNIDTYKPGRSSIRNIKKVVKLSANESALGVSSKVKKIISKKKANILFFISFFLCLVRHQKWKKY